MLAKVRIERRVIRVASQARTGGAEVRAAIEDRYHHFRILARTGATLVESVAVEPLRFPYILCPAAGARTSLLDGRRLSPRMSDYFLDLDARHQCTHQFDVAALALATAAQSVAERLFEIEVIDSGHGNFTGTVYRNGSSSVTMVVAEGVVHVPTKWAGRLLGPGFTAFTTTLDVATAEAALLLRRMMFIAADAKHADSYERAYNAPPFGGCWVQQPERNEQATRLKGRVLPTMPDFAALTADDDAFLALG